VQLYLPIAEFSLNIFLLIGMGGAVGFLSGLFGVGGGFLLTPLLIFSGIPAPVAVASVTSQVVAASIMRTCRGPNGRESASTPNTTAGATE